MLKTTLKKQLLQGYSARCTRVKTAAVHFEKQVQITTSPNSAVNRKRNTDYQRKRDTKKRDVKG